jgi:hypothetical protein
MSPEIHAEELKTFQKKKAIVCRCRHDDDDDDDDDDVNIDSITPFSSSRIAYFKKFKKSLCRPRAALLEIRVLQWFFTNTYNKPLP